MRKPDWIRWLKELELPLWQAVLLSLNIEPDDITARYRNFSYFCETNKEAEKRVRHVAQNLHLPEFFSPSTVLTSNIAERILKLEEFAEFANGEMQWGNLPPELVAIAQPPNIYASLFAESNPQSVTDESTGQLTKREKQIRAIEAIANELKYKRLGILDGQKKTIEAECKKQYKELFGVGPDPFKRAWQAAVEQNRMKMQRHAKYSKR